MIPDNEFWWWVHPFCIEISWRSTSSRPFSYLSTIMSLWVLHRWTSHILTTTVQRSRRPCHTSWVASVWSSKGKPMWISRWGESTPGHQGGCRCRNPFFWDPRNPTKKHKKQGTPKRNNTNSGYCSWFVSSFFQLSCFVLFSSCHLVFFCFGNNIYIHPGTSFIKGNSQ